MVTYANLPEIFYLGVYEPITGECDDLDFTWYRSKIWNLKHCEPSALEAFADCISSNLGNDFDCLAVIPSHHTGIDASGIRSLCKEISKRMKLVDATSCLIRHETIDKLSTGGDRNIERHLNSIKVVDKELIEGKKVLLFDDVTSTGNSLKACKELLESAGAKAVKCFALGKTTRFDEDLEVFCSQYDAVRESIEQEEEHSQEQRRQVYDLDHNAIEDDYCHKLGDLEREYDSGDLSDEDYNHYDSILDESRSNSHREIDYQDMNWDLAIDDDAKCQREGLDNLYKFSSLDTLYCCRFRAMLDDLNKTYYSDLQLTSTTSY
jgi:hypoxanthine phosphoribosyltransferase